MSHTQSRPAGAGRPIRIAYAEDHQMMRQGIVKLLQGQPGLEVIIEASDGEDLIQ